MIGPVLFCHAVPLLCCFMLMWYTVCAEKNVISLARAGKFSYLHGIMS